MENYQILPVDESWNDHMLAILADAPIHAGGLTLYFDKSPDIFNISRTKYTASEHLGFFHDGCLKGFASLGYFDAFVSGQQEQVFTFYNFFLLPEIRGRRVSEMAMQAFFSSIAGKANYGVSVTLRGNRSVESYIGRRVHDWMPPTRVIDELVVKSILFSIPKKNKTEFTVRNACLEDVPAMVKLLQDEHRQRDFGLVFQEDTFQTDLKKKGVSIEDYYVATDKRGTIKGVCLAWDCYDFRRTRVLRFSADFSPMLFAYKALSRVIPMTTLPEKGHCFRELTITDYAVSGRNAVIMHAMLSEIYHRNHNRRYHFMNFASCSSDPLLKSTAGFWSRDIVSHIIFTSLDPSRFNIHARLPYIDIAFL